MRIKKYALMFIATACCLNAVSLDEYLSWSVSVEDPKHRDPSYYFILAAGGTTAAELVSQIHEDLDEKGGNRAFVALANLLGGDNSLLPFSEVAKIVKAIESQASVDSAKLSRSYQIVAFYNTEASLEFLIDRTKEEFWEQNGMPTFTFETLDAPDRPTKVMTAQIFAVTALSQHPNPRAEAYLKSLLTDPAYTEDKFLLNWARSGLKQRNSYHNLAYQKRQEAQSIKDARNQSNAPVEESVVEVASAPAVEEVAEVIEEVIATEPVIEEPAEVVAAEPVEEDVEQSSNWWLWLIGAVVVVGGVFMFRSRK